MNRNQFFQSIADHVSNEGLAYIQRAYWLVKEAHRKQHRRLTGERYFEHVRRVACIAIDFGYRDVETITLALIHDVVEDTFVPPSVIASLFGREMYEWALVLSKEHPSYNVVTGRLIARAKLKEAEYYTNLAKADLVPQIVKGCDRIDNLGDFPNWEPARREKYITETTQYILPITDRIDSRISSEIRSRLEL